MSTQMVGIQAAREQETAVHARPGKSHLPYVDNLRTMLITFVILLHMAITYIAQGDWYYSEPGEKSTIAFVISMFMAAIGSAFAMGLFFLLAGYFSPHAYDRKGFGPFLLDRMKRLLVPLAFYEIIIYPLIRYAVRIHDGYQGSFIVHLKEHFLGLDTIADGPAWFLLALLIFSLLYAMWRLITKTTSAHSETTLTCPVPGNWTIALFAFGLGLITFFVRLRFPVGVFYEPWHQELAHYPQYIAMFTLGTMAYRRDWLTQFSDAQAKTWRWVALVCVLILPVIVAAAGALSGKLDERGAGGWNWLSFSYSMWEGFICPAMVIITLAWFRKRFNRQGQVAAKMAEATFTAYVIHPVIIVPLALLLSGISMNLDLKFIIVSPFAVALTYLVAYYFRRLPLIKTIF